METDLPVCPVIENKAKPEAISGLYFFQVQAGITEIQTLKLVCIIRRVDGSYLKFTIGIMVEVNLEVRDRFLGNIVRKNHRLLCMSNLHQQQEDYKWDSTHVKLTKDQ